MKKNDRMILVRRFTNTTKREEKMKRKTALVLIMVTMLGIVPNTAFASPINNDEIITEEQKEAIDALYRQREELAADYFKKNSDGTYTATNLTQKAIYTIQSAGYTDYNEMCWNFYKYKNYGTSFSTDHFVHYCYLNYKVKNNGTYTGITNGRITLPVI